MNAASAGPEILPRSRAWKRPAMQDAVKVMLATFALCPVACVDEGQPESKPKANADLDRLLALASSDESTKGFHAIRKLRDLADERAVPILSAALEKHVATNRIHGFAAAQGLFCIGTEEAHEVLRKHLLSDVYSARLGIDYALAGWNMDESKRHAFIEQYHLQSTSKDIGIEVASSTKREGGRQKIEFKVTLRNDSKKSLRVFVPAVYLAGMLILRFPNGHFSQGGAYVDYEVPPPAFSELKPGKSVEFRMAGVVRYVVGPSPKGGGLCLEFKDIRHRLEQTGRCRVYAMYAYERAYAKRYLNHGKYSKLPESIWYGRAVSEPVEIEIDLGGETEDEARRKAEEEEARRRAEEEARRREGKARRRAKEEARRRAKEEARRMEEEDRRKDEEAVRRKEEEKRRQAEEEARRRGNSRR